MAIDRTVETRNWITGRTLFIGSVVCVAAREHLLASAQAVGLELK